MDGTILPSLPQFCLHIDRDKVDAEAVVVDWLSLLQKHFDNQNFDDLSSLFIHDCWWRDILGLAWDFTSKQGTAEISTYLRSSDICLQELKPSYGGLKPHLVEWVGDVWIQAAFSFQTQFGQGQGVVRLINEADGEWRAWIVFTQLEKLSFSRQNKIPNTESGTARPYASQVNGVVEDAAVLIVGAGQAGVSLAARLGDMGIRALLVDRHERVGDSWRKRYDTVILHTPTFTDHYPFLKYPENWPEWLSRDQVANFMEHYSQLMGLELMLSTTVTSVKNVGSSYEVVVSGPQGHHILRPKHVVLATGVFSDTPSVPSFKSRGTFDGIVYHSSQHRSARQVPDLGSKNIVVIGCGTSGHDIAQDFVNHGAKKVCIIQRNPIFSLSLEAWKSLQLGLWNMDGLTTEEADLLGNSIPLAVARTMSIGLTRAIANVDKVMLDGLRAAGLALRIGNDGYGLADYQLILGGHYYIDHGANQMIIDGRIKIYHCKGGVEEFGENFVTLADGVTLGADVVVLATGYEKNIVTVRHLMGNDVADQLKLFGDLDDEQERAGWWRPTGILGFWYMTGSFMWCRQFSQTLALQIAHAIRSGE